MLKVACKLKYREVYGSGSITEVCLIRDRRVTKIVCDNISSLYIEIKQRTRIHLIA